MLSLNFHDMYCARRPSMCLQKLSPPRTWTVSAQPSSHGWFAVLMFCLPQVVTLGKNSRGYHYILANLVSNKRADPRRRVEPALCFMGWKKCACTYRGFRHLSDLRPLSRFAIVLCYNLMLQSIKIFILNNLHSYNDNRVKKYNVVNAFKRYKLKFHIYVKSLLLRTAWCCQPHVSLLGLVRWWTVLFPPNKQ